MRRLLIASVLLLACSVMGRAQGTVARTSNLTVSGVATTWTRLEINTPKRQIEFPCGPIPQLGCADVLASNRMILVSDSIDAWRGYNVCLRTPEFEKCVDIAAVLK